MDGQARVSDVVHTAKTGWILSGGRDKYFHYHCVNTGGKSLLVNYLILTTHVVNQAKDWEATSAMPG